MLTHPMICSFQLGQYPIKHFKLSTETDHEGQVMSWENFFCLQHSHQLSLIHTYNLPLSLLTMNTVNKEGIALKTDLF
jgi:hypothetical protein